MTSIAMQQVVCWGLIGFLLFSEMTSTAKRQAIYWLAIGFLLFDGLRHFFN